MNKKKLGCVSLGCVLLVLPIITFYLLDLYAANYNKEEFMRLKEICLRTDSWDTARKEIINNGFSVTEGTNDLHYEHDNATIWVCRWEYMELWSTRAHYVAGLPTFNTPFQGYVFVSDNKIVACYPLMTIGGIEK